MIVSIDGADAVGKTTITTILKDKLNAQIIKTPACNFLPAIRSFVDENKENTITRFIYYLASIKEAIKGINNNFEELIVLDRYLYSTIATHIALDELYNDGKNVKILNHLIRKEEKNLFIPDLITFLYINKNERNNRLLRRDKTQNNNLDFDEAFAERTQQIFKSIALDLRKDGKNVIEIDTSNICEDKVYSKIETKILVSKNLNRW